MKKSLSFANVNIYLLLFVCAGKDKKPNYIKMKNNSLFLLFAALFIVFFTTACDPDEPDDVNEEELITNLNLTLTPSGGGTPVVFSFQDLDGDGGTAPQIVTANLAANTTYNAALTLTNQSVTPFESITDEVIEEDDEHQLFYSPSSGLNLTVAYQDQDGDGNPLGILTTFTTGAASTGTFTVTLRHEPNKTATGVAAGDITNAGGETDIEVVFTTSIQ